MGPIDKIKFKDIYNIYDSLSVLLLHILQILHNMQACLAERIGKCWYPQELDMESSIYTGCIYDFGSSMQACLAERIGNCWYPQEFDMESLIYTGCIYDFGSEGRGFVERGGTMERGLNKAFTVNYSFEGHFG